MEKNSPSINHTIPTYAYLIGQIHWLSKQRKTTKERSIIRGINLSITVLLCTYIESALNELFVYVINNLKEKTDDDSYLRLLNNLENRLLKATWTQYMDIGKTLLPHSLLYYSDNEIWKGISILFKLRNQLVHGKNIKASIQAENEVLQLKYSGIFKIALKYFKEKRILRPNELNSLNHKILSTRTTNHFVEIGESFVDGIVKKVMKEQGIDNLGDFTAFKDNILMDFGIAYKPKKLSKSDIDAREGLPF
tara:strand:- start:898 stop:1647 length:750 start_codon:yes stop_codon:yes gene_type:complete